MTWRDLYSEETLKAYDEATDYFKSMNEYVDCTSCPFNGVHGNDGAWNYCNKHEVYTNLENTGMCLDFDSDCMDVHNAILFSEKNRKDPFEPLSKHKEKIERMRIAEIERKKREEEAGFQLSMF